MKVEKVGILSELSQSMKVKVPRIAEANIEYIEKTLKEVKKLGKKELGNYIDLFA